MTARGVGGRALDDFVHPLPAFAGLPPLPPVREIDVHTWVGPTEESNWVIFPCLIVGAYPSSTHDPTNVAILTSLLKLGVTTFVCLQQEYQHEGVTEAEWRSGAKLRPYIFDAIKLVDALPASFFSADKGKPLGLEFVHFPIQDCAIANDSSVLQLARDLCDRLLRGETMYLHCWGGHGRTGTVVSLMLGLIYGLSPLQAMRWVQFVHDLRLAPMGTPSPQTETQRQQVTRILKALQQGQKEGGGKGSGGGGGGAAAVAASSARGAAPRAVHGAGAAAGAAAAPLSRPQPAMSASAKQQLLRQQMVALTQTAAVLGGTWAQPVASAAAAAAAARAPAAALAVQQQQRAAAARVGGGVAKAAPPSPRAASATGAGGGAGRPSLGAPGARPAAAAGGGGSGGGSRSSSAARAAAGRQQEATAAAAVLRALEKTEKAAMATGRVSPPLSLSPRPSQITLMEREPGGGGAPRSYASAIAGDARATAVAPHAASAATVLGLAPLPAARRVEAAAAAAAAWRGAPTKR